MRLDIFLPFLRKWKRRETPAPAGQLNRLIRRCLPPQLFSDRVTGKPGLVRKWLRQLGPTAASSPIRRAVQTICFAAFLWLFFYVCWPYSARPAPAGQVADGWKFIEVDAAGDLRFAHERWPDWIDKVQLVHVVESAAGQPA